MQTSRLLRLALLALATPAAAALQTPPPEAAPRSAADAARQVAAGAYLAAQPARAAAPRERPALALDAVLSSAVGLHPHGDGLAGAGPGYVATFDARGFRMRAHAGGEPGDRFAFRLAAVERGGAGLAVNATPRFVDRGTLAVARHGAALDERYALRPDGVEQSFVLHALPAGAGDLVLRGRVETPLRPLAADDGGLLLARDGDARLRIGGVRAFDADGRSVDGRLRWSGDELELVVPGAFVDAARLPLLVDPVVSAAWDLESLASEVDVAYDATHDVYVATWWLPGGFVQAQRFGSDGAPVGGLIQVSSPDVEAGPASVANVNASDAFPVAYQVVEPPLGVYARTIDAATGAVSGAAKTVAALSEGDARPQVGGDPIPPYDDALVVWWGTDGTGADRIYWQLVDCPPAVDPKFVGAPALVAYDVSTSHALSGWRVTNSNGPPGTWLITYATSSPGNRNVWAYVVHYDGEDCVPLGYVASEPDVDEFNAAPAGDGESFAVVYERDDPDLGSDVYAVCFHLSGISGCVLDFDGPATSILSGAGVKAFRPDVEVVDGSYLAAWERVDGKVESVRLSATTCVPCGPHAVVSDLGVVGPDGGSLRLASRWSASFAVPDDQVLVAWEDLPQSHAALVKATQDGLVVDLGGGCGEGPDLSHLGDPTLGASFDVVLAEIPEGAFNAGLMVAAAPDLIDLGGCQALLPSFAVPLAVDPPELVLPVPMPCDGDFAGVTWRFQFFVLGVPGEPLGGFPGVTLSNAIEVTFGG